jgi:hypothetical protein
VFVDELDLGALGFAGAVPEATGRPAYHPAALLKIYLYGYLNRVPSSWPAAGFTDTRFRLSPPQLGAGRQRQPAELPGPSVRSDIGRPAALNIHTIEITGGGAKASPFSFLP